MAKSMARIENGIVINIEWCSDNVVETDTLIDIEDRPVDIGNTYIDGKFYDNGIEVLTEKEILYKRLAEYEDELAELDTAFLESQYQNIVGGL
jgi:hypothetical protein